MKITENFLTVNKFSRPGIKLEKVTKIAVHYVGNPGSSAIANRNYFENQKNGGTYVSSHFVVGLEGEIIQCIPLDEWSYCTNQANGYSISIECCHPDSTGKFNEKTEASLAELCAYLLKKFGLSSEDKLAVEYKDECPELAELFYNLSTEEKHHADLLHEKAVSEIEKYRKNHGEPPKEMLAVYDYIHCQQIEKTEKAERYRAMYRGAK